MTFDPEMREMIAEKAADKIVAEIKESLGGLGNLVVLRLNVAAQLLGLSKAQAGRILPSVELGPNSAGVTLGDLQHAIASRRKATDRTRGGVR